MALILSHPFRLAPNGTVAKVEQADAQADAEQVAVLVTTRPGERPLASTFGMTDPAFSGSFEPSELLAGLAAFGPPVNVTGFDVTLVDDATSDVTVRFE